MALTRPLTRPLVGALSRGLTQAGAGGGFAPITATGGTVTEAGGYRIHTFTTGSNFIVTDAGSTTG